MGELMPELDRFLSHHAEDCLSHHATALRSIVVPGSDNLGREQEADGVGVGLRVMGGSRFENIGHSMRLRVASM